MTTDVRRAAFVAAGCAAVVACSLTTDLTGFSEPAGAVGSEAGAADAPVADALVADASADVSVAACKPSVVIDTALTSSLGTWSPRERGLTGYPRVESFFGSSAAVILPFVDTTPIPIDAGDPDAGPTFSVPPEHAGVISGLWQTTALPLRAFDVELEVHVKCTNASSCADGVGFSWLDTTSPEGLTNANAGHKLGLPSSVGGMVVILDDYKNEVTESSDPDPPSLEIVKLDPTKDVGLYPWIVVSKTAPFLGAWHKLGISVRGPKVSVSLDGMPALSSAAVSIATGLIGISTGTGGQTNAVAVRNFKGSFYDCTP